jgi:hypothetical protein
VTVASSETDAARRAALHAYLDAYAPLPPGALPATGHDPDDPAAAEIPPGEEPVATGTLFIMVLFLMMTGALWGIVYLMLLNR